MTEPRLFGEVVKSLLRRTLIEHRAIREEEVCRGLDIVVPASFKVVVLSFGDLPFAVRRVDSASISTTVCNFVLIAVVNMLLTLLFGDRAVVNGRLHRACDIARVSGDFSVCRRLLLRGIVVSRIDERLLLSIGETVVCRELFELFCRVSTRVRSRKKLGVCRSRVLRLFFCFCRRLLRFCFGFFSLFLTVSADSIVVIEEVLLIRHLCAELACIRSLFCRELIGTRLRLCIEEVFAVGETSLKLCIAFCRLSFVLALAVARFSRILILRVSLVGIELRLALGAGCLVFSLSFTLVRSQKVVLVGSVHLVLVLAVLCLCAVLVLSVSGVCRVLGIPLGAFCLVDALSLVLLGIEHIGLVGGVDLILAVRICLLRVVFVLVVVRVSLQTSLVFGVASFALGGICLSVCRLSLSSLLSIGFGVQVVAVAATCESHTAHSLGVCTVGGFVLLVAGASVHDASLTLYIGALFCRYALTLSRRIDSVALFFRHGEEKLALFLCHSHSRLLLRVDSVHEGLILAVRVCRSAGALFLGVFICRLSLLLRHTEKKVSLLGSHRHARFSLSVDGVEEKLVLLSGVVHVGNTLFLCELVDRVPLLLTHGGEKVFLSLSFSQSRVLLLGCGGVYHRLLVVCLRDSRLTLSFDGFKRLLTLCIIELRLLVSHRAVGALLVAEKLLVAVDRFRACPSSSISLLLGSRARSCSSRSGICACREVYALCALTSLSRKVLRYRFVLTYAVLHGLLLT